MQNSNLSLHEVVLKSYFKGHTTTRSVYVVARDVKHAIDQLSTLNNTKIDITITGDTLEKFDNVSIDKLIH